MDHWGSRAEAGRACLRANHGRYSSALEPKSEGQLLEAAQQGDAAALEQLIEAHQQRVYRFGMKMCRRQVDAEDVLQETLLAAARSIREFRGGSSFSTWLYAIARSFCLKKLRRSKYAPPREHSLEQEVPEEAVLSHPGAAPDEAAGAKELRVALERAIDSLEADQREVLLLRDVEGLRAIEVGEALGISVAAVKSRLHRARLRVRELLAPTLQVAEPVGGAGACPEVLTLYSKHLEGEISTELCTRMRAHLEGCARCRNRCDSLKRTLSLCSRLPPDPVPAAVQDSVRAALRGLLPLSP